MGDQHPVHGDLPAVAEFVRGTARDDALVTYDRRMLETARGEGLSAHVPGMAD
ncbi:hypothetical protein ACFV2D_36435 [Streptomyces capillispiralis]|uniref:hypothetical protein n=1 Tax=Streptomyces capillispiralis TaxID=68182 RepID=UPI00368AE0B2